MTPRRLAPFLLAAVLVPVPVYSGDSCLTIAFDAEGKATVDSLVVPSGCTYELKQKTLAVRGPVTVAGTLHLNASTLVLAGATDRLVSVGSDGVLRLSGAEGSTVKGDGQTRYDLDVRGRVTGVTRGYFEDARLVRVFANRTDQPVLRNASFDAPTQGLRVQDSVVRFDNVSVYDSPSIGASVLRARLDWRNPAIYGAPVGLLLGERAAVALRDGYLGATESTADLNAAEARLWLNGTVDPWTRTAILSESVEAVHGARAEHRVWARSVVTSSDGQQLLRDVQLEYRNGTQATVATFVTDVNGTHPTTTLRTWAVQGDKTGTQRIDEVQPYQVLAKRDHHAVVVNLDGGDGNHVGTVLKLPTDRDDVMPVWPSEGAGMKPGWNVLTNRSTTRLSWSKASDGEAPHAISHYLVYRQAEGGLLESVATTNTNTTDLKQPRPGVYHVRVAPVDLAGNQGELSPAVSITYDDQAPRFKLFFNATANGTRGPDPYWFRDSMNVTAKASDDRSSNVGITYEVDGPEVRPRQAYQRSFHLEPEGTYKLTFEGVDAAGNRNVTKRVAGVDRTRPGLRVEFLPAAPNGEEGWYRTAPNVTANATDAGGVHSKRYRWEASNWTTFTGERFQLAQVGSGRLRVNVTDRAGNTHELSYNVKVDRTPPTLTWSRGNGTSDAWSGGPVTITLGATDAHSGVRRVQYAVSGGPWIDYTAPVRIDASGSTELVARAWDRAGNEAGPAATHVRVDPRAPSPARLLATSSRAGEVLLDWGALPPRDDESGIARILIERRLSGSGDILEVARLGNATLTTYVQRNVPGGVYEYRLRAEDAAGNEAFSAWDQVLVDSAAQLLEVNDAFPEPVQGRIVLGLKQTDRALDAGVESVSFFLDGDLLGVVLVPPYEWEVDTRLLADGTHRYTILLQGVDGSYEEVGVFEVDNDRPLTAGWEGWLGSVAVALGTANIVLYVVRRRRVPGTGGST